MNEDEKGISNTNARMNHLAFVEQSSSLCSLNSQIRRGSIFVSTTLKPVDKMIHTDLVLYLNGFLLTLYEWVELILKSLLAEMIAVD